MPSSPRSRSSRPTGSPPPPSSRRRSREAAPAARPRDPSRPGPRRARAGRHGSRSRPAGWRWRRWAFWPAAGSGARDTPAALTFLQRTFRDEAIYNARFAPDGQTIVYSSAAETSAPDVFVIRPDYPAPTALGLTGTHLLSVSSKGELAVLVRADSCATGCSRGPWRASRSAAARLGKCSTACARPTGRPTAPSWPSSTTWAAGTASSSPSARSCTRPPAI